MDFRLTQDQIMLRDTVRRIALENFAPRAAEIDRDEVFPQENFKILAENAAAVSDYRNGTAKAAGFLIGQAMQASKGKANPKLVKEIFMKKLAE